MQLNPEADIEVKSRKISGERTTNYAMRRSRAQLEQCMSSDMIDAERDIALGWNIRAGHMGYGSNDLTRVRGVSERDLDTEHRAVKRLIAWMGSCRKEYREVVLAIAVFATPISELCSKQGIGRQTAVRRFHRGLLDYCTMHGMPAAGPRRRPKNAPIPEDR